MNLGSLYPKHYLCSLHVTISKWLFLYCAMWSVAQEMVLLFLGWNDLYHPISSSVHMLKLTYILGPIKNCCTQSPTSWCRHKQLCILGKILALFHVMFRAMIYAEKLATEHMKLGSQFWTISVSGMDKLLRNFQPGL